MKDFFNSTLWNTVVIFIMGIISIITQEIVTFIMLGFLIIILTNIYDKLDDISKIMKKSEE
ncbi:Uncharacterized [Syntrophomonas zehnderi OL-4]|uniref:Uncharacterized n=1 Tax=Syntrophomonas zehnderi OL-4 TaxID=690567 RepID=A0A0E4G933_9FIRM|nr:Uncharacterized [Syntrophomonas zehnderi OL-4]